MSAPISWRKIKQLSLTHAPTPARRSPHTHSQIYAWIVHRTCRRPPAPACWRRPHHLFIRLPARPSSIRLSLFQPTGTRPPAAHTCPWVHRLPPHGTPAPTWTASSETVSSARIASFAAIYRSPDTDASPRPRTSPMPPPPPWYHSNFLCAIVSSPYSSPSKPIHHLACNQQKC
jgi:hypothetical protein